MLAQTWQDTPVTADEWVIVGNGWSRHGHWVDPPRDTAIACCNTSYRDAIPFDRGPSVVVAWDGSQIRAALEELACPVVYPKNRHMATTPEHIQRSYRIMECRSSSSLPKGEKYAGPWDPLGSISGLCAYQLAMLRGAKHIALVGMDCSVDERGLRTCVTDGREGYEHNAIELARCVEIDGVKVPKSWVPQRDAWRTIYEWGLRHGIRTSRMHDAGSLTFIPVLAAASR